MASDLKIEIFAFKLFNSYLYKFGELDNEPNVLEIYGDECAGDNSYLEACDELYISAFYERSYHFSDIYLSFVAVKDIKDFTSLSEISDYVIRMCDRDDLFGNLTVFERMLATSEFVISICYSIHTKNGTIKDVLKYGHVFWVMYFDRFIEEFYKEGGWNKLKIVAKSYAQLTKLFKFFGLESLWGSLKSLKEAACNYIQFQNALQTFKCWRQRQHNVGNPQPKIRVSALWIKYRIKFFHSYFRLSLDYEEYIDSYEMHWVLEQLKFCCDPSLYHTIYGVETTQQNTQESSLTEKVNTFEHSLRIENAFCSEFSNRMDLEKQFKSDDLISSTEEVGFGISNKVENIQFDEKILSEIEMPQYNAPAVKHTINSPHKQNLLSDLTVYRQIDASQKLPNIIDYNSTSTLYLNENKETKAEEFYSKKVGGQSEIAVVTEVFSTNQKGEHECNGETAPKSFCNPKDTGSLDECEDSEHEMINAEEKLEINIYSKKGHIENSKTTNKVSINNMGASKFDGEYFSDILPKTKQLSPVNRFVDTGDEVEIIQKAREDLRSEQRDPEMNNFLRLILLLGDNQVVNSVPMTLRSNKEKPVKLHEKSNKKKKRSKKKSGK